MVSEAPYASWRSPITSEAVAATGSYRYSQIVVAGDALWWSEARPLEGGRVVVRRAEPGGTPVDAIPDGFNARTRVHEYGGGAYAVSGATVFFSNFDDQRIYRLDGRDAAPSPITPEPHEPAGIRYADGRVTADGALLICVRERRATPENVNELVAVPTDGSNDVRTVASGHDFYSSPRISPDGRRLAWLAWDHPRMPWDGCELYVGLLSADGRLTDERRVAGGPAEAIVQPEWGPEGALYFSSDRTNWWNLYRTHDGDAEPLAPIEAEIGGPMWVFGQTWYAFLDDARIVCTYFKDDRDHLATWSERDGLQRIETEFSVIQHIAARGTAAVFAGASPARAASVVSYDVDSGDLEVIDAPAGERIDERYVSMPRHIEYPTAGGDTAHMVFHPPHNPDFVAPKGERPPLIVEIHGGPTAHVRAHFDLWIQFFTSRGFAIADVNYGGSTGYGRAYRERLNGQWGVVDAIDAVNAARFLADAGEVDRARMAIAGGSAGGWTTLCALVFHDVFAAGENLYGVSDLMGFVDDTHKFESRYIDTLVGPWPEAKQLWYDRSPINFVDRIDAPLIVFQGLEDEVVPPSQSEVIVDAVAHKGLPHAYLAFEGEQHGFRRAETVRRVVEAELYFYSKIFRFTPADDLEPVDINNL